MEILKKLTSILKNAEQNNRLKTIFVDTNFIIYLLEGSEDYLENVKRIVFDIKSHGYQIVISRINEMEYLVKPFRDNKDELIDNFYHFLNDFDIKISDVDEKVAIIAAKLRAYNNLKQMDALLVGTAINEKCSYFITNDFKISNKNIDIKTINLDQYDGNIQ